MTQNEVDKINAGLYDAARIYWRTPPGAWSSPLWENMVRDGWHTRRSGHTGPISVYDASGARVMGGFLGRVAMLVAVGRLMR